MRTSPTTDRLVEALLATAPAGWGRIEVVVRATVLMYDFEAKARLANGAVAPIELSSDFVQGCQELRQEMYEPGRGTWFSMRVALDSQLGRQVDFNFDLDPLWEVPPEPASYTRDVETFPRDEEHMPDWLRAAVELGQAEPDHVG